MMYEQKVLTKTAETAATVSSALVEKRNVEHSYRIEMQKVLGINIFLFISIIHQY